MRLVARIARGLRRACFLAFVAGAFALVAGFVWYASVVDGDDGVLDKRADAIVALTGGPDRIGDAIELLAAKQGERLLITGVNRATRADELAQLMPRYQTLFSCCIDLDRDALNTIGNAVETRNWVRKKGYRSVIVVTSNLHMPRALAELGNQLPDVELIPYRVVTDRQRSEPWWSSPAAARAVVTEYLKYIVAVVRMRLEPGSLPTKVAADDARG